MLCWEKHFEVTAVTELTLVTGLGGLYEFCSGIDRIKAGMGMS